MIDGLPTREVRLPVISRPGPPGRGPILTVDAPTFTLIEDHGDGTWTVLVPVRKP